MALSMLDFPEWFFPIRLERSDRLIRGSVALPINEGEETFNSRRRGLFRFGPLHGPAEIAIFRAIHDGLGSVELYIRSADEVGHMIVDFT